jgi:hypothetical protein
MKGESKFDFGYVQTTKQLPKNRKEVTKVQQAKELKEEIMVSSNITK